MSHPPAIETKKRLSRQTVLVYLAPQAVARGLRACSEPRSSKKKTTLNYSITCRLTRNNNGSIAVGRGGAGGGTAEEKSEPALFFEFAEKKQYIVSRGFK